MLKMSAILAAVALALFAILAGLLAVFERRFTAKSAELEGEMEDHLRQAAKSEHAVNRLNDFLISVTAAQAELKGAKGTAGESAALQKSLAMSFLLPPVLPADSNHKYDPKTQYSFQDALDAAKKSIGLAVESIDGYTEIYKDEIESCKVASLHRTQLEGRARGIFVALQVLTVLAVAVSVWKDFFLGTPP
jgi:hypothetical protein